MDTIQKPNEVRAAVLAKVALSSSRLIALGDKRDHDARLLELQKGCGQLAVFIANSSQLLFPVWLERIAAFAAGWAEQIAGGPNRGDIFKLINVERVRQEYLLLKGKHLFTCASQVADPKRKFRVLTEEVGEVAEAIDRLEYVEGNINSRILVLQRAISHLMTELIQVAAVAVAWLESLEVAA